MRALIRWRYFIMVCLCLVTGCQKIGSPLSWRTWHAKVGWKAEEYFDDPRVIALCDAIEANDVAEMKRLIAAGANANAIGRDNMTPLLWAFPDNKLERFKCLLAHGADPNVIFQSNFGASGGLREGESVTHMATGTRFPGYFEAVYAYGGDPNLVKQTVALGKGDAALHIVITSPVTNKRDKLRRLIDMGADLDHIRGGNESTPAMQAVTWFGQYDLALLLLEAGADPHVYSHETSNLRLVHLILAEGERRRPLWTPQQQADYNALVTWLKTRGVDFVEAQKERDRWASWSISRGEFRDMMDAEVAARKAREAQGVNAAQPPDHQAE